MMRIFASLMVALALCSHSAVSSKGFLEKLLKDTKKIEHPIIKLIDGTPKANIQEMLDLIAGIVLMQQGSKESFLVVHEGHRFNIKQLKALEKTYRERTPANANKAFRDALNDSITLYGKLSSSYLKKARGYKRQMLDLIKTWSRVRNLPKTMLIEWGNQNEGQEIDQLKKTVKNFEEFDKLLTELTIFLKDLISSCTSSLEQFKHENPEY